MGGASPQIGQVRLEARQIREVEGLNRSLHSDEATQKEESEPIINLRSLRQEVSCEVEPNEARHLA